MGDDFGHPQSQINQANDLFNNYGNNPENFINNLKSMSNNGNDLAKAGIKLACEQMKSKGLDNLDGYDRLCSGALMNQAHIISMICVLFIIMVLTKMMFKQL